MESVKEQIIRKYAEITGSEPITEEWEPRIKKMLAVVCQGYFTREEIISLTDTGLGNNGGAGIVLTSKAICVKDFGNSTPRFIAYFKDIEYCLMQEDKILGIDISALELHMKAGKVYRLSTCLAMLDLDEMQLLIEFAMSLYDLSDAEEDDEQVESTDDEGKEYDEIATSSETY